MEDRWEIVNGDWEKVTYKLAYGFNHTLYQADGPEGKIIRWAYSQELWDNLSDEVVLSNQVMNIAKKGIKQYREALIDLS